MSTELTPIKGEYEVIVDREKREVAYSQTEMNVTSFWGGTQRGPMIQLAPQNRFIQLTKDQVIDLIGVLKGWL